MSLSGSPKGNTDSTQASPFQNFKVTPKGKLGVPLQWIAHGFWKKSHSASDIYGNLCNFTMPLESIQERSHLNQSDTLVCVCVCVFMRLQLLMYAHVAAIPLLSYYIYL